MRAQGQITQATLVTAVTLAVLMIVAGCTAGTGKATAARVARSPSATSSTSSAAPLTGLRAADAFVARQSGTLGIVVRDRLTGAVWRAGATRSATWTASTIKLAIAADLLERQRAGTVHLTAADRSAMSAALVDSDNDATNTLWDSYGGADMLERFRDRFGMAGLVAVPGYPTSWHYVDCTVEDLQALMSYVLERMSTGERAYLVDTLRHVASNQHWGVWAAGTALRPGNKDGWSDATLDGTYTWYTHTVGFAGDRERYVVAVMYRSNRSLTDGVQAVSDLVATVFGAPVPAQVPIPPP